MIPEGRLREIELPSLTLEASPYICMVPKAMLFNHHCLAHLDVGTDIYYHATDAHHFLISVENLDYLNFFKETNRKITVHPERGTA